MKQNLITWALTFILLVSQVSAVTLIAETVDFNTLNQINPSTVEINGISQIANPTTTFSNLPKDQVIQITSSATNYIPDVDQIYFDPALQTLTGTTQQFTTSTLTTTCNLDTASTLYVCVVSSNGVDQEFIYNPVNDFAGYTNYLHPSSTIGQPPVISATVTPASGNSPLVVTFTNLVFDDEEVTGVVWDLGDGTRLNVETTDTFSHTYVTSGTYVVRVVAADNIGLTNEQIFSVVVDNDPNPSAPNLPFNDRVLYDVTTVVIDGTTDLEINPSTIRFATLTQTGTPYTTFQDARSNTVYDVESSATGYNSDRDSYFFDFNLNSCNTQSCSLVSRNVFNNVFVTECSLNSQTIYDCVVSSNGVSQFYQYNPANQRIGIINYLISDSVQGANQPPQITASATPTRGDSPLVVNFNAGIVDDGTVASATWFFGDGSSFDAPAPSFASASHTYTCGGVYTARLAAWDDRGLVATQDFTITVDGQICSNNLVYNPLTRFNLIVGSADGTNDQDLTGTVTVFDGTDATVYVNNPYTSAISIFSNTAYRITNQAPGYGADTDAVYFDFQLPTCTTQSCDLISKNFYGEVFTTSCSLNNQATYDCIVSNNGVDQFFLYEPTTNNVGFINYLAPDGMVDPNPTTVFVTADPTEGIAPFDVEFQNNVQDDDGVAKSIWYFGDGTSAEVNAVDSIEHEYTQPGIYEVQFVTFDTLGFPSTESITITATKLNGELPDEDDDLSLFIRSIQIPGAYDKNPGDTVELYLTFENDGDEKLHSLKATATIPELGLYASQGGSETLYKNEDRRETIVLQLPYDIEPGLYWVRIQLSADETDRIIHREIRVVEPDMRPKVGLVV